MGDDAGAGADFSIASARRHGGDAVAELGFADGTELDRAVGPIHGGRFDDDRRLDVVAAVEVLQQFRQQVVAGRAEVVAQPVLQMMMGIDDGQGRLEGRFA